MHSAHRHVHSHWSGVFNLLKLDQKKDSCPPPRLPREDTVYLWLIYFSMIIHGCITERGFLPILTRPYRLTEIGSSYPTSGAVAVGADPLVVDTGHLPDGFAVRCSRTCDVTGNSYDVTVSCHPHARLHCGIDATDHCSDKVCITRVRFYMTSDRVYLIDAHGRIAVKSLTS